MIFLVPQTRGFFSIPHGHSTYIVVTNPESRKTAKARPNCASSHHFHAWQGKTNDNGTKHNLDAYNPDFASMWTAVFGLNNCETEVGVRQTGSSHPKPAMLQSGKSRCLA